MSVYTTSIDERARPKRNIVLSPFGYYPKPRFPFGMSLLRLIIKTLLCGLLVSFLLLSGCSKQSVEGTLRVAGKVDPSVLLVNAALDVVEYALDAV